jgi:lipid-A-disaccharide synthase
VFFKGLTWSTGVALPISGYVAIFGCMKKKKKVMIIAGEASGDMHGARLVEAMLHGDADLDFFGIGGEALQRAGVHIRVDNARLATVGIWEALVKLKLFVAALGVAKKDLKRCRPDLLILIDYPDFNFRVASAAKKLGIPVMYYISPQIWAWRTGRIKTIKRIVDHMVVIFPFETAFYERWNVPVTFVGHPLLDHAATGKSAGEPSKWGGDKTVIGLLPGSRNEEVSRLLPTMVEAGKKIKQEMPDSQFVVPVASTVDKTLVEGMLRAAGDSFHMVFDGLQDVLHKATLVITASGTATLETAISCTPMIVVYKVSGLSYWLGKRLIRVKQIALANLVAGKPIVPELIQDEACPEKIASVALSLVKDERALSQMRQQLKVVGQTLGAPGASKRAADVALALLSEN